MSLNNFFNPKSISVIGASKNKKKFGYVIIENLIREFNGKIYPIHLKEKKILGLDCYSSVTDVKEKIDLAIIVISANMVPNIIKECSKKHIKNIIIISGGFSETGNKKDEQVIKKLIKKNNMRIIGPNTIGIYDSCSGVDTIFDPVCRFKRPTTGFISFISQSGAFGAATLDLVAFQGIGINKFISLGNKIDVDEIDIIKYLSKDKKTKAIILYIEGIDNGREFIKICKKVSKKKPIIALKSGKSKKTKNAIMSHTGSLAGHAKIYSGAFKQSGIIEVEESDQLFDFAKAFAQPLPKSNRIMILTNGGGFGCIATDEVDKNKLVMASPYESTIKNIKSKMPDYATISNPMDLIGDADSERYEIALENLMKDNNIDGIIVIILMQISTLYPNIIDVLLDINKKFKKPLLVCMMGGKFTLRYTKILEKNGVPCYSSPEKAVSAFKIMVYYKNILEDF